VKKFHQGQLFNTILSAQFTRLNPNHQAHRRLHLRLRHQATASEALALAGRTDVATASHSLRARRHPGDGVVSKLKCPVFLANEMSGFAFSLALTEGAL
jgi:hypothetical protein